MRSTLSLSALLYVVALLYVFAVTSAEEASTVGGSDSACACSIPRSAMTDNEEVHPPVGPPSSRRLSASAENHPNCQEAVQNMAVIPGREFGMGTSKPGMPDDGEGPRRRVSVSTFLMDKYEVNNLQFSEFVEDTGYVTDAEKWKWSFVLLSSMTPEQVTEAEKASLVRDAPWWAQMFGSYWREPEGPGSHVFKEHEKWGERGNHPAVHISWNDADAFCKWRQGSRLPTEAEWELAARGPVENKVFPWGNVLMPNGTHRLNIFTGEFPDDNTASDGYLHTAPVDAYGPQNDYGMYNMVGNVWEWVSDWWITQHRQGPVQINPTGPASGQEKVKKGGSFLCHKKFCYRYRNAARFKVETDSGTQNSGFRCAKDVPAAAVAASD